MAKKAYLGVENLPKNVSQIYLGINNLPKKVIKGYVGVNGVPKVFWDGGQISEKHEWEFVPLFKAGIDQYSYYNPQYFNCDLDSPSYNRIIQQIENPTLSVSHNIITTGTNTRTYAGRERTWPSVYDNNLVESGIVGSDFKHAIATDTYTNNINIQGIFIPIKNIKNIIKLAFVFNQNSSVRGLFKIGIAHYDKTKPEAAPIIQPLISLNSTYINSYYNSIALNNNVHSSGSVRTIYDNIRGKSQTVEIDFRYFWTTMSNYLEFDPTHLIFIQNSSNTSNLIQEIYAIKAKNHPNNYINNEIVLPRDPYSYISDYFISQGTQRCIFGIRRPSDSEISYDGSGNPQINYYLSRVKTSPYYDSDTKVYIGLTNLTGTTVFPTDWTSNGAGAYPFSSVNTQAIILAFRGFSNENEMYKIIQSFTWGNWNISGVVDPDTWGDESYEENWIDAHFPISPAQTGTYRFHSSDWGYAIIFTDMIQYVTNPRVKGYGGTFHNIKASYDKDVASRTNIIAENFIQDLYNNNIIPS